MPLYEYEPLEEPCPRCAGGFELLQSFSDPPLEACPECGRPVRRVISAASVRGRPLDPLQPANLARHGFSRYERDGDGSYRKTVGPGPETFKR